MSNVQTRYHGITAFYTMGTLTTLVEEEIPRPYSGSLPNRPSRNCPPLLRVGVKDLFDVGTSISYVPLASGFPMAIWFRVANGVTHLLCFHSILTLIPVL